jgi:hypothetical protein
MWMRKLLYKDSEMGKKWNSGRLPLAFHDNFFQSEVILSMILHSPKFLPTKKLLEGVRHHPCMFGVHFEHDGFFHSERMKKFSNINII